MQISHFVAEDFLRLKVVFVGRDQRVTDDTHQLLELPPLQLHVRTCVPYESVVAAQQLNRHLLHELLAALLPLLLFPLGVLDQHEEVHLEELSCDWLATCERQLDQHVV